MTAIDKSIPLSELGFYRTQHYNKHFNYCCVIPRILGRYLPSIPVSLYSFNFNEFIKIYFNKEYEQWFSGDVPQRMQPGTDGYNAFEEYSKTIYGSSVIGELVNNKENYKDFIISEGTRPFASAEYKYDQSRIFSNIFIPKIFPSSVRFNVGGQLIDKLAIIHHEFYHTKLWQRPNQHSAITLRDERRAVLYAENPVRLYNGFEPRYAYYSSLETEFLPNDHTINVVTQEIKMGKWTVSIYDIKKLVQLNDGDAMK